VDNAPHWKDVKTYPFHVHIKDQEAPLESKEMFVNDVIEELKKLVLGSEKKKKKKKKNKQKKKKKKKKNKKKKKKKKKIKKKKKKKKECRERDLKKSL